MVNSNEEKVKHSHNARMIRLAANSPPLVPRLSLTTNQGLERWFFSGQNNLHKAISCAINQQAKMFDTTKRCHKQLQDVLYN